MSSIKLDPDEIATIQPFLTFKKKQQCDLVQPNVCIMLCETCLGTICTRSQKD